MVDRTIDAFELRGPRPRTIGMIILLFIIFIFLWSSFVIVPAGHRGVVLWWGSVEKRVMG
jgi:regulator of protease activity HflC (stomatin/prohibitin superfamily)